MENEEIINKTNKEESLASLYTHTGWKHMEYILNQRRNNVLAKFRTVRPDDSIEIAKMQAKLEIISEIINKPGIYFEKQKNNGG